MLFHDFPQTDYEDGEEELDNTENKETNEKGRESDVVDISSNEDGSDDETEINQPASNQANAQASSLNEQTASQDIASIDVPKEEERKAKEEEERKAKEEEERKAKEEEERKAKEEEERKAKEEEE
eukprot:gene4215-6561_t